MVTCPAIDGDGHILERQDEIRPYLATRWRERTTSLWPGAQPWDAHLSGKIKRPCGYSRRMPAKDQVATWDEILKTHDIEQAILFTTGAANVCKLQEPEFAVAAARAVNDHLANDYRTARLHPMGVLPLGDPVAAAAEVARAAGLGLKGFEILTDGLPFALGDPYYDPIYEVAEAHDVAICVHGSRSRASDWGAHKLRTFAEVHAYAFPAGIFIHFVSVICQGLPVRFPKLRFGFFEIGASWLPYFLDRLDEHWEKRGADEMPLLKEPPSELFRRSGLKVSIEGKERMLRETIDFVGADHLVYATDIPHWDGEFPENLDGMRGADVINNQERRAILRDNAAALFAI